MRSAMYWGLAAVLTASLSAGAADIALNQALRYQTIEGLGTHMDIDPWKVRQGPFYVDVDLDAVGLYDSLISELGVTIMRTNLPEGFEPAAGSFDPSALSRNIRNIRKLLAAAARQSEPFNVLTSCFSPPGWMKDGGVAACGVEASPPLSQTTCKLSVGMEPALATYFETYIRTIRDSTGCDLYALSLQNEAAFSEPYVSCVYDGPRYRDVLKAVGSRLRSHGLQTGFYGAEHMSWAFPSGFETSVRGDAQALGYMHAWAVHGYTDGVHTDTGAYSGSTPTDKPLWMTETQGSGYGTTLNDWPGAMALAGNLLSYLRDGRITVWTWGSVQTVCGAAGCEATAPTDGCLIMNGTPTAKWYVSRHFYRFIRPGARQIASSSSDGEVDVVAFRHEARNCWTVVLRNRGSSAKTVNLTGAGVPSQFTMEVSTSAAKRVRSSVAGTAIAIPASSVVTLVAGPYAHADPVPVLQRQRPAARSAGLPAAAARFYTLSGRRVAGPQAAGHGLLVCRQQASAGGAVLRTR